VYIGLGANLGADPRATVIQGMRACAGLDGLTHPQGSSIYCSEPVQARGPQFYNAVLRAQCTLEPLRLLSALQAIELQFGRQRPYQNAPRTLDLDILLFGDLLVDLAELTIPHPRMHQRAFVLRPLLELDPHIIIPGQPPPCALLAALSGQWIVRDRSPVALS
jgi:2-amino-4-hydroxy-6-hydroxymethyldihydropteridine diphosphokinase